MYGTKVLSSLTGFLLQILLLQSSVAAETSATRQFMHKAADIDFYVEQRGSGPDLVLIPSGQGDSGAYKLLADELAGEFRITTFDMPGFSRSSAPNWHELSNAEMARQIAVLVKSLGIEKATFYGCSSSGAIVLSLAADHPELVRNGVLHEPALMTLELNAPYSPPQQQLFYLYYASAGKKHGSFYEAAKARAAGGDSLLQIKSDKWSLLGEDHMERRFRNHGTWVTRYLKEGTFPCCSRVFTSEEVARAPVLLTMGMQSAGSYTGRMGQYAGEVGLETIWLPGKHSPYVTYPDIVADVIRKHTATVVSETK